MHLQRQRKFEEVRGTATSESLSRTLSPVTSTGLFSTALFRLEKLCLSACGIQRILIDDGQFPSLTTLNIKENRISEARFSVYYLLTYLL